MVLGSDSQAECKTCRFWHPSGQLDLAECQRFPPGAEGWPVCAASDRCGEYRVLPTRRRAAFQVLVVLAILLVVAFAIAGPLVVSLR